MEHHPGSTLELLLTREFAPLPDRLESVAQRLTGLGDYFAAARDRLGSMPSVFVETARLQLQGSSHDVHEADPRGGRRNGCRRQVRRACADGGALPWTAS